MIYFYIKFALTCFVVFRKANGIKVFVRASIAAARDY